MDNNDLRQAQWELVKEDTHDRMFNLETVYGLWPTLLSLRNTLGLTDQITDEEMINENFWAINQYRKYVFSKQSKLEKNWDDVVAVEMELESMLANADEKFNNRQEALYHMLRDSWIYSNLHYIKNLVVNNYSEGDEDDE